MARNSRPRARNHASSAQRRRALKTGSQVRIDWLKHLEIDGTKALPKVGAMAVKDIRNDATRGQKGNNRPMPDLTQAYEVRKLKEARGALPDLYRTGRLWREFGIISADAHSVTIGFHLRGAEDIKKWRTLKSQGRDPLKLSSRDKKRFAKALVELGLLKEVPGPPPRTRRTKAR